MLDEYALVLDIFDRAAHSNPDFIDVLLPHLREPLFQQALVRDICDGGARDVSGHAVQGDGDTAGR